MPRKKFETRHLLYACTCGEKFAADVSGNGLIQQHVRNARKHPGNACERLGIIDADTGEVLGRNIAEVKKKGIRPLTESDLAAQTDPEELRDELRDEELLDDVRETRRDRMRPPVTNNRLARGFVAMRHVPIHNEVYFLFQHVREIGLPGRYDDTPEGLGSFLYDMVHMGAFANRRDLKLTVALSRGFYELLKHDGALGDGLQQLAQDFMRLVDDNAQAQYPAAIVSQPLPPAPEPEPEPEDEDAGLLAPVHQRLDRMEQNMGALATALANFTQVLQTKGVRT